MAVVKQNVFIEGIRGAVGNAIFRFRNGVQELYARPRKTKKKPSAAQKAQRFLMKLANGFAKQLKTNPQMRAFYEEMAKKRHFTNAYHAAISHCLTNPKIMEMDFSEYLAQAAGSIRFKPTAWDKVIKVKVTLKDAQGETMESGWAQEDSKGWWYYLVQESHEERAATVVFEIHDDVPKMKTLEVDISA